MLLPNDMLDKLYYYHHDTKSGNYSMTDIVTVVYQGWLWKTSKTFNFKRRQTINTEKAGTIYTQTDECFELINQLHDKMEQKVKEKENETPK